MTALVWIGAAMAAAGLAGLGVMVARARALRADPPRDHTALQAEMSKLVALNAGSVAGAFLGLALMAVGLIL